MTTSAVIPSLPLGTTASVTVIGVAGPPGAGKSTLVRALVAALADASAVYMDDYQRITQRTVAEIAQLLQGSTDFNALHIPLLPEHLLALKQGQAVIDPVRLMRIEPRSVIVLETHFGRAHHATGQYIDYLVWLATPPDVALARNVRDLVGSMLHDPHVQPSRSMVSALDAYLANYLDPVRALAQAQRERIAPDANCVVDASADTDGAVQIVLAGWRAWRANA